MNLKDRWTGLRLVLSRVAMTYSVGTAHGWLDYTHARPDRLAVYLDLNRRGIDFQDNLLPQWPAQWRIQVTPTEWDRVEKLPTRFAVDPPA